MKLNMWLLADRLKEYGPKWDIKNGAPRIEGIRFISENTDDQFDNRYVYLYFETKLIAGEEQRDDVVLINAEDLIVFENNSMEDILNAVLKSFEFYNFWESRLWNLAAGGNVQDVVDAAFDAAGNPIILSDMDGTVLAMTSRYLQEDLNDYWTFCRKHGKIPPAISGSPVYDSEGHVVHWTDDPKIYYLSNHTKTISVLIEDEGEPIAAMSMWEYEKKMTPGDCELIRIVRNVILSMQKNGNIGSAHANASILTNLLDGREAEEEQTEKIENQIPGPWELLLVDNPYSQNIVFGRSMVRRMAESRIPCVPVIYKEKVVCLVSASQTEKMLSAVGEDHHNRYSRVVKSVPFHDLGYVRPRYEGMVFSLKRGADTEQVRDAGDDALDFLMTRIRSDCAWEPLVHPALHILSDYDSRNKGGLYDSLYYYLLYERSVQKGADAVHVHRNSYMYRIHRIVDLTGIDLDDPLERAYLLASFFLEKK